MGLNRRALLTGTGATLMTGGAAMPAPARVEEARYPHATLAAAFRAAGFAADGPECFTVVWAADVHYGIGKPEQILPPLLNEVNALSPRPAFLGIAGDLIVNASRSFGQVPGEEQKRTAIAEFRALQRDLGLLDPRIPLKLTLGNHDTYPGEPTPELFHAVFPAQPVDHAFSVKGVRFLFLNGGSCGLIDARQRAWFRQDVRQHHRPGATLITVCHQPSLGSLVSERGIPAAFREALADCEGDLWMMAGHIHQNGQTCFRLPKAVLTQASMTAGNPATWGQEQAGYWVDGFRAGKLATRVFRRMGQGYAVAPPAPRAAARPLVLPFEGQDGILWKVLVGEGDRAYYVDGQAAWCLNYWHYNKHLVYRFPLTLAAGKARRFCVLGGPSDKTAPRYFVSADGQTWQEATDLQQEASYTRFSIPPACREAGTLAVRLEGCAVSGFALTT